MDLRRPDPLANANRVAILQAIGERPGATPMDLARVTGLQRSTVNFHLGLLRRASLVDVQRHGRFGHYMLNSRSYRFPADRIEPAVAPDALPLSLLLALVQHRSRAVIFQTLLEAKRPLTYHEFLRASTGTGFACMKRTTFLHHARVLCREGILRRGRRGKEVEWAANVDYAGLLRKQARIYLCEHDRGTVVQAVPSTGAVTREAICSALRRSLGEERVDELLLELRSVGFLTRSGAGTYSLNRRGVFQHMHAR